MLEDKKAELYGLLFGTVVVGLAAFATYMGWL